MCTNREFLGQVHGAEKSTFLDSTNIRLSLGDVRRTLKPALGKAVQADTGERAVAQTPSSSHAGSMH